MAERKIRTSAGRETASQTASRARKMLSSSLKKTGGSVSKGDTSRSRLDEIAGQDFITKENRDAYNASRPITPDSIGNKEEAYQPPTAPVATDLTGQSNQINAMLAGATGGTYDPATGFTAPPAADTTGEKGFEDLFKSYMGTQEQLNADRPSQESFVREMQKELRPKENLVNQLQNQITSITTDRDAAQLGLEGQGRGITDTIIGGQQARIGREAAIQALPIQAQLAAAQGDLDSARTYLGQLYTAKSADAQAEYQYKTSLASSIYGFLDAQQKRRVDAATKEQDRAFGVEQANLAYQRQLGLQALEYGQNGLITGISAIDPSSPTFEQDMAAFTSQLRKPVAAVAQKAPTTQTVDGKLYQYDYETGTWNLAVGAGGAMGAGSPETESLLGLQQVLSGLTADTPGFSSAVGFGLKKNALSRTLAGVGAGGAAGAAAGSVVPIAGTAIGGILGGIAGGTAALFSGGEAVAGTSRADFETQANRLSDMFLVENLDKMTGVLTDKDLEVLRSEGTTIGNLDQSQESWLKERERLTKMVERGIQQNGLTVEQAVFYGYLDPVEASAVNDLWNTKTTTPAINFNY